MQLSRIPTNVLADLRESELSDDEILLLTPEEVFAAYCTWHGLLGWSSDLWTVVRALSQHS